MLRTSGLEQYSRWGFIGAEGQNHFLRPADHTALMQSRIQLSFWAAPRNFFLLVDKVETNYFGKLVYFIDSVHGE